MYLFPPFFLKGMTLEESQNTVLVSMQVQLGEIKGILNTIVQEHARRITDTETNNRQLRFDLDTVKSEAKADVNNLQEKLNQMAIKGQEDGSRILQGLNENITTNRNAIAELRVDVTEVKDKQNASFGKLLMIASPVIAAAALLWNILGK